MSPEHSMKVLGYSERGILNALFYEIAYHDEPAALMHSLLSKAMFPPAKTAPPKGHMQLLIEQSFSDFGDADALLLIDGDDKRRCSVFVEAKVRTIQDKWNIRREFRRFENGMRKKVCSSNLFSQLYYKYRLVKALKDDALNEGVVFPPWAPARQRKGCGDVATSDAISGRRKIGKNDVVLNAAGTLKAYCADAYYLAIVPDNKEAVKELLPELHELATKIGWDLSGLCYLTWQDVEDFCKDEHLQRTITVFDFNGKQIFLRKGS